MSCCSKEKMERNDYNNTCKSHSAKSDREMYRICPSKLSKRELEDLYFTLLENNLELKKTINGQQEKIRVLSTQVQRLTNTHDKMMSKEMKECSTSTKAFVNEQKDFITELKETNKRMAERIQQLNMRLCSAKQFAKTTPPLSSNSRRFRASTGSPPKKHDCLTKDQDNEQFLKRSTSSQWEDRTPRRSTHTQIIVPLEKTPRKSTQTENIVPIEKKPPESDQPCDENKCRSLMEELKIKIVTLEDELFNVHDEYSTRITRLETEVSEVRKENIRVCSERSASEHELQNTVKRSSDILAQYRLSEAKCSELTTELAIEKRKVAELETQLKAANMSDKVNKTIEDHLTTIQDENAKCMKCCFKNESAATESSPNKNGKLLSPRVTATRSPTTDKDSTKSSKTGDDSGYQDTQDLTLHKQNRELMAKIMELQNLVDTMKIEMSQMSEVKPSKHKSTGSPKKTRDFAAVATAAPILGELAKVEIPKEQIKYNKTTEGENYDLTNLVPFPPTASDERVNETGKVLNIEILGNPKEPSRTMSWDYTRAKTIEDADGTLQITEDTSSDKFSPLDLINDDYREKTDSPKLQIVEKKKLEIPGGSKLGSANVSIKSATSDLAGFNPEKFKYLEAEGILAKPVFLEDMPNVKEDTVSLTESVPSNPELGFGIPRLASKISQEKNKAESEVRLGKRSAAVLSISSHQARKDLMELKLPMTEALVANHQTTPKQVEDCENCLACSFDKECELKHKIAINQRTNTLAPGMQKEQAKKDDQHNSFQIPGPIPTSDGNKREKFKNLFSSFIKNRSSKEKKEDPILKPKTSGQQTTATTDEPVNLPDVSILDIQPGTDSIKINKQIMTYDKTDHSTAQKKETLTEEQGSKDAVERKPSRIAFSMDKNLDPPLLEVKMPTYHPHSERMLPTLLAPTNWRDSVDRKTRVAQSSDQNVAEKSSQATTHRESAPRRGLSVYRRRSGTLRQRAAPAGPAPPVCTCAGQQDGYCSDKHRKKAHDKEEMTSLRDQRRPALTSDRGTYTVNSKQTDTSPDNTDLEMTNLSDLPMEKEKKSMLKVRPWSPGEDRTTTFTNTHSYYSPPSSLLSEGEMPVTASKRKLSNLGIDMPYLNAALPHKLETPPSQQMEAALHAISEELQRCRIMLHAHRPAEVTRRPSAVL